MPKSVKILSTGGTIASTNSEEGAGPSKRGEDLVASLPELGEYAELEVSQVAQKPSNDMDPATMAAMATEARQASRSDTDGIVVTHGTDTMEESAYYLDLVEGIDLPVVFTGAQRRPDEVSSDGPYNLITAVRAATHGEFQCANGSYIVFNGEVHASRYGTKSHTTSVDTFVSPEYGPVGMFTREGFRRYRELGSHSATIPVAKSEKAVRIVSSVAGADGRMIEFALEDGAAGIVVEGTGLGNTTGGIGDAIREAIMSDVPVVVTSRCSEGPLAPIYGGRGGAKTLWEHGVLNGDSLSSQKARLKLMLALEYVSTTEELATFFEP